MNPTNFQIFEGKIEKKYDTIVGQRQRSQDHDMGGFFLQDIIKDEAELFIPKTKICAKSKIRGRKF